jgi:hypothetical protein
LPIAFILLFIEKTKGWVASSIGTPGPVGEQVTTCFSVQEQAGTKFKTEGKTKKFVKC